jgi:hypothetical protein
MIMGIPESRMRVLPTDARHPSHPYGLDPAVLEAAVLADEAAGLLPFFLSATLGTTR